MLYRKAPVGLGSDCSQQLYRLDLFFKKKKKTLWTVDDIRGKFIFHFPFKMSGAILGAPLSSPMGWQQLVGVVQRNQPCLHGRPMVDQGSIPLYGSGWGGWGVCRQLQ